VFWCHTADRNRVFFNCHYCKYNIYRQALKKMGNPAIQTFWIEKRLQQDVQGLVTVFRQNIRQYILRNSTSVAQTLGMFGHRMLSALPRFIRKVQNAGHVLHEMAVTQAYFFPWRNRPSSARVSSLSRLHDHSETHTTLGRTPLDG
jgi:hypothetical protein